MKRGPDFLGIGPPKTGTTWLYHALSVHPQVSLPPCKEIRYFWETAYLGKVTFRRKMLDSHWHFAARRRFYKSRLKLHTKNLARLRFDAEAFFWDVRFMVLPHSDEWYFGLFDADRLSGDITPKYCELPTSEIQRVSRLLPNLRVIVSLRNPVDREWSRAKMNLVKKRIRSIAEVPDDEFIRHFDDPRQDDYAGLLGRWRRYFGDDRIHVFFYDQLLEDPWRVYLRICQFLGLERPDRDLKDIVCTPRNVGVQQSMPDRFGVYLYMRHRDSILRLTSEYPDLHYPAKWLNDLDHRYGSLASSAFNSGTGT